jgi:hypothetical protein
MHDKTMPALATLKLSYAVHAAWYAANTEDLDPVCCTIVV